MITLTLWQMRWRLLIVAVIAVFFYIEEPGFHLSATLPNDLSTEVSDPRGLAFTLANLAGLSMLVLLFDFVAGDRRRGYYRMYFSHPTRPLAFYAVRWGVGYALSLLVAALFLVGGQLLAWGELRAGAGAMVQPALFALIYGGLTAFFSVLVPLGDSLLALLVFWLTEMWQQVLAIFAELGSQPPLSPVLRQAISFVLPPHLALRDVFEAAQAGTSPWGAIAFAAGYGLFWLALAALLLWSREWP
ncbi:MAG TPA: hypothetical protein VFJ82_20095 [Longimicrobium sp.]|nr:hypothetical protein [Longimicrobium sp.]